MNTKKIAADEAIKLVQNGMTVGLGTGSTAYYAIEGIGRRMREEGLTIRAIATSARSEAQAHSLQIPIVSFTDFDHLDLTIDGADECDYNLNLIKGGGGALLREKIVASNSRQLIIIGDKSKLVQQLGRFPLPVEVVSFGLEKTFLKLKALGCQPTLRLAEGKPYVTDNNNFIIDCQFAAIPDPKALHDQINSIVGVVENGLFINLATQLIIASETGDIQTLNA
ncbi:MAG: ribose 5-phosphate isomerase A [Bacteroidetes bacterium]|nr:MAG: ribose 5-phosphate isomerase A [Bacteroidota bacterium]